MMNQTHLTDRTGSTYKKETEPSKSTPSGFDFLLLGIILLISGTFAWVGTKDKAPTFDEIIHVGSGFAYWTLEDYRLQPENGNLPQRIAALPHYVLGTYPPINLESPFWHTSLKWHVADEGWYRSEADPETIKRLSRASMLIFSMLGLIVLFLASYSLWGKAGAFLSTTLAAFSPNFLGHMPLATSDFTGTWTLTLAIAAYSFLCRKVSLASILLAGTAVGLTLLSKHSNLAFGVVAASMLVFSLYKEESTRLNLPGAKKSLLKRIPRVAVLLTGSLAAVIITLCVIWTFYSWRFQAANPEAGIFKGFYTPFEGMNEDNPFVKSISGLLHSWQFLPEAFIFGLSYIIEHDARTNFLNGEVSNGEGFPLYFLFCFIYKTPLPALLLHVAGLTGIVFHVWNKRFRISVFLFGLIAISILYTFLLVTSDMNIGYRHAFPVLYISCIFAGSLLSSAKPDSPVFKISVWFFALSLIPLAWFSRDRYIAFINPIGGGEKEGYKVLRDSSLDWGQDLPAAIERINNTVRTNPDKRIYFAYFGSGDPQEYGLKETHYLPASGNNDQIRFLPAYEEGLYVMSANATTRAYNGWPEDVEQSFIHVHLAVQSLYERLIEKNALNLDAARTLLSYEEWQLLVDYESLRFNRLCAVLEDYEPDEILNGTILVYDLTSEELEQIGF